jgi:hypothetical protein
MTQPSPSEAHQLGSLKASYEANRENTFILRYPIPLSVLVGLALLVFGFRQDYVRDLFVLVGGGLFLFLVAVGLYFAYRGQLRMGVEAYDDGFVFTNRRNHRCVCRWDDVTEVYESIIYRDPGRRTGIIGRKCTVYQTDGQRIKLGVAIQNSDKLGVTIQAEVRKRLLPRAIETYKAGGTVAFGPELALSQQGLTSGQKMLPWDEVADIKFGRWEDVRISQKGKRRPWKSIMYLKIANYFVLREMLKIINLKPQGEQLAGSIKEEDSGSGTGFPQGGIGNISARIGYDVRELLMQGYSMPEIHGIMRGEYTVQELLKMKPGQVAKKRKRR